MLFHEIIVQVGNKDTMNATSENGQLAKEILSQYIKQTKSYLQFSKILQKIEITLKSLVYVQYMVQKPYEKQIVTKHPNFCIVQIMNA